MSKYKKAQVLITADTDLKSILESLQDYHYAVKVLLGAGNFTQYDCMYMQLHIDGTIAFLSYAYPDKEVVKDVDLKQWLYENIKTVQMTQAEYDALHQSRIEHVEYMRNVENGVRIEAEPDPEMFLRDGKVWVKKTPTEKHIDIVRDLKTYADNMVYMLSMLQNTKDFSTLVTPTTKEQTCGASMNELNNKPTAPDLSTTVEAIKAWAEGYDLYVQCTGVNHLVSFEDINIHCLQAHDRLLPHRSVASTMDYGTVEKYMHRGKVKYINGTKFTKAQLQDALAEFVDD